MLVVHHATLYELVTAQPTHHCMTCLLHYSITIHCQVDPNLSRTVLVSTKLDTRIPQFATASDVQLFFKAPGLTMDTQMLGGAPFYT